jgi:hypothetical protein
MSTATAANPAFSPQSPAARENAASPVRVNPNGSRIAAYAVYEGMPSSALKSAGVT